MTKTIRRQVTSVVTDIKLDNERLVVHAIDQDKAGNVLASHDLNLGFEEMTPPVRNALRAIVEYAQAWADEQ